eukprot:UN02977
MVVKYSHVSWTIVFVLRLMISACSWYLYEATNKAFYLCGFTDGIYYHLLQIGSLICFAPFLYFANMLYVYVERIQNAHNYKIAISKFETYDEQMYCPICYEQFGYIESILLICGHRFCKQCSVKYEKIDNRCPCCRMKYDKELCKFDFVPH